MTVKAKHYSQKSAKAESGRLTAKKESQAPMTPGVARPIKICFTILKAYPLFNPQCGGAFGGAELDMYFLATELAKDKNFNVSFVVGDYRQHHVEIREGVRLIKSADVDKNLFLSSWRIWRALSIADAEIYVGKAYSLNILLQAAFCKIKRRKYVYRTAHSSVCDGTCIRETPLRGTMIFWAIRSAKKVLTQNRTDANNLLATMKIHSQVIGNGHRLPPSSEVPKDTILWVGRSVPFKQPHLFLDLARELPDHRFTMICQPASHDNRYDELVERAKQIGNLQFIPRVPFHEIDSYFQRAKIFVNTSDSEGFPNTFIQACKCTTPILSFNVNPDGFLDKYKCGICAQKIWSKFIDGFKTLIVPEKMEEYGKNGRSYVEQNHDIKKIVQTYKTLFARLARRVRR